MTNCTDLFAGRYWTKHEEYTIVVGGGVSTSRHGISAVLFVFVRTAIELEAYSARATRRVAHGTPLVGARKKGDARLDYLEKKEAQKRLKTPKALAEQISRSGDDHAALAAWKTLLKDGGDPATCHFRIAIAHSRMHSFDAALTAIDQALANFLEQGERMQTDSKRHKQHLKQHATAQSCKGQILWEMGRLNDSIPAFEHALSLHPKCTAAQHKLQEVQRRLMASASKVK